MMGVALGGSLAREHGAKYVVPIFSVLTIVCGLVFGWAINGWIAFSQASASH
jgi:hypothetical protein